MVVDEECHISPHINMQHFELVVSLEGIGFVSFVSDVNNDHILYILYIYFHIDVQTHFKVIVCFLFLSPCPFVSEYLI